MHINLEGAEKHAVQAYSDNQIQINSLTYERSVIVSREEIITELTIKDVQEMDESYLNLLLQCKPEVVIIGHEHTGKFPPMAMLSQLSQQRIGVECMSLGAACRTYNVLLGEQRDVVGLFIL